MQGKALQKFFKYLIRSDSAARSISCASGGMFSAPCKRRNGSAILQKTNWGKPICKSNSPRYSRPGQCKKRWEKKAGRLIKTALNNCTDAFALEKRDLLKKINMSQKLHCSFNVKKTEKIKRDVKYLHKSLYTFCYHQYFGPVYSFYKGDFWRNYFLTDVTFNHKIFQRFIKSLLQAR